MSFAIRVNGIECLSVCVMQQAGGTLFVDVGSSMDIMHDITFLGNTLAIQYDLGLWVRTCWICATVAAEFDKQLQAWDGFKVWDSSLFSRARN